MKLIQTSDSDLNKKNLRAINLLKERKLLNIARLAMLLGHLFVLNNNFKRWKNIKEMK